ncbi:MAG: HDOD domain-containing protein [Candidatus Krumholzibacteriota bacterium]|nr:HDOD domain-containing protein [Candidatus Krumholzibacteriota bacterium]
MKTQIDELFKNVKTLPTLPVVVQKIFASINDPKVGAKQLAEIITSDQSLTARVLKLVNSSFFGLRGKVQNINNAVTMLGFSTIRQICLGSSICGKFRNLGAGHGFSDSGFWAHSIGTATISKKLSIDTIKIESDICYTIGLIHDIGKLLLLEHHSERYLQALDMSRSKNIPLQEAETAIFGTDHAEIGNWLFRKWNLPRESRRAVKNHHSARVEMISPVSPDALTALIYFSNQLAHHFSLGSSGNADFSFDDAEFRKFFGISLADKGIDSARLKEEVAISLEVLGIKSDMPSTVKA